VIAEGRLYEGTGRRGQSGLRQVDLETGQVLQSVSIGDEHFGEGIAVLGDRIYQLTWQTGICFVYDRDTFDAVETFNYATEGWGLTTDGERLIMSDGSNRIVYRNPRTFQVTGHIEVHDGQTPVPLLNELEYIDGEIWANVYTTNWIVRIDPTDGSVTGWIDLTGILAPNDGAPPVDVLNGIAQNPDTGRIYVTGKLWPTLFEIELVPLG
jgi:glutamine cyclotransferase